VVKDFRDLEIYKLSLGIAVDVYRITKLFPKEERFSLTDQLQRAIASIGANIAEGFGRFHYKDKLIYCYNSRGSLYEAIYFLELAFEIGYVNERDKTDLISRLDRLAVKLNNFISATKKTISYN